MDDQKQQLVDKLKSANNILVTVSRDPSVDQLASLLGLTLLLNKQGKHSAAVFSGEVPSTLEFLQPEDTIEKNTDSLRDFIIALDKAKADKLRYKVEDNIVKIFITPYKTSITQDDFDFSQGDFNVDVVIAIGVHQQEDLDDAITAHGRILHDATVASINITPDGGLGTISWHDPQASSLSELVTELGQQISSEAFDEQIATALLTGIVSETDRFRNEKTSSRTMTVSAALMSAGANQQLVASKLEEPAPTPIASADDDQPQTAEQHDGVLDIDHKDDTDSGEDILDLPAPEAEAEATDDLPELPELDDLDVSLPSDDQPLDPPSGVSKGSQLVTEPPQLGGTLTANSSQPGLDPVTDPLSMPATDDEQLLDRKPEQNNLMPPPAGWTPPAPTPPPATPVQDLSSQTLTDIEASVEGGDSVAPAAEAPDLSADAARDEVSRALNGAIDPLQPSAEPVQALNAQPLGPPTLQDTSSTTPAPSAPQQPQTAPPLEEQIPGLSPTLEFHKQQDGGTPPAEPPTNGNPPPPDAAGPQVIDPTAPPPVPPPIPFQFGDPPKQQ